MDVLLNVKVRVPGMTDMEEVTTLPVEAFDKVTATIPTGGAEIEVEVAPGSEAAQRLIVIRASVYSADLSYKVHDAVNDAIILDTQHVYVGSQDAVTGTGNVFDKLFFINNDSADVDIEVLVARDATP